MKDIVINSEKAKKFVSKYKNVDPNKLFDSLIDMIENIGLIEMSNDNIMKKIEDIMRVNNKTMTEDIKMRLENLELKINNELKNDNMISKMKEEILMNTKIMYTDNIDNIIIKIKERMDVILMDNKNVVDLKMEVIRNNVLEKLKDLMELIDIKMENNSNNILERIKPDILNENNKINKMLDDVIRFSTDVKDINVKIEGLKDVINMIIINKLDKLCDNNLDNITAIKSINEFIDGYKSANKKGVLGENKLYNILIETFPSHDVIETKNIESTCDYLLRKEGDKDILIENKYYKNNVKQDGVDKFLRDIKKNKCHGILLSQTSGIVNKNNLQVDIEDDIVVVYIHNVNFDPVLINLGFKIIKIIENKITNLKSDGVRIDNYLLKDIYDEYNNLICEFKNMLNDLEIYYKNTKKRLELTKMDKLSSLLNKHFLEVKNEGLLCDICNKLYFKNKRALAKHKITCIKNKTSIKIISTESSSMSEDI